LLAAERRTAKKAAIVQAKRDGTEAPKDACDDACKADRKEHDKLQKINYQRLTTDNFVAPPKPKKDAKKGAPAKAKSAAKPAAKGKTAAPKESAADKPARKESAAEKPARKESAADKPARKESAADKPARKESGASEPAAKKGGKKK